MEWKVLRSPSLYITKKLASSFCAYLLASFSGLLTTTYFNFSEFHQSNCSLFNLFRLHTWQYLVASDLFLTPSPFESYGTHRVLYSVWQAALATSRPQISNEYLKTVKRMISRPVNFLLT